MKYTYNNKISARANERLRRRTRALQIQKRMFTIAAIIVISLVILLGSSIRAFADSRDREVLHKYYTSIMVQSGDTLWDIADDYVVDGVMSREDFIDEVSQINHLSDGQIHRGDYIVVAYYSTEEK